MTERLTGDYSEILATKSQELAELTKAFNEGRFRKAAWDSYFLMKDFQALSELACRLNPGSIVGGDESA